MTRSFPTAGLSQAFLNGACVMWQGRPGRVTRVDQRTFSVEFPDAWITVDGDKLGDMTAERFEDERAAAAVTPPVPDLVAPLGPPATIDEPESAA